MPKLSVLLGTHNRADMLARCLDSVQQTTVDCEIVVLDDGSSDDTPRLLAERARQDARIRPLRNEQNIGAMPTYTRLYKEARGEYLNEIADDDLVLPCNWEKKLAILDAHPEIDLIYSRWYNTDKDGNNPVVATHPALPNFSFIGGRDEFRDHLPGWHIHFTGATFRRRLYDDLGELDHSIGVLGIDFERMLRYTKGRTLAYLDEPLVKIAVHAGSYTQTIQMHEGPRGRIQAWRRWLIESADPVVVDPRNWGLIRQAYFDELPALVGQDPGTIAFWTAEFEALYRDYLAHMRQRFAASARFLGGGSGSPKANVVWSGPVFDAGEDGDDLRAFVEANEAARDSLRLEDAGSTDVRAPLSEGETARLYELTWTPAATGERLLHVRAADPRALSRDAEAALNVALTTWDTDRLPDDAARLCNAMDRVWLPSDFHREVFESAGVDASKIRLLPPCAPASTIAEASPISLGTGRSFNFLTLVEWTPRSGWDIVVRAFASAFQPDDDVALVILAYSFAATNLQQLQGEIQQVLGSIMGQAWRVPPITVNLGLPSAAQRPGLYRAAQACVHANRGARGSRALLEAMTCGCPAIGTGWGGNLAFMTDENSYLIESGLQAVPGADGQQWAESSVEHLAELMQGTVKNRAEADAKGARARAAIARDFSPAAVGRRLRELYSDVRPG